MPYQDSCHISAITMEDHLGIVYLIETAQQFWSELEDILKLPSDNAPTLSLLDSTLRRFISLCATYHEQYLQSPLQLEHACNLLIESELFQFHSERMCEIIAEDARNTTDPHSLFISYHVLYHHGHRRSEYFRLHKRWQPLIPLLMDHILVGIDPDIDDTYVGTAGVRDSMAVTVPVPIEAKLRSLGVKLLYEVSRVQKLSVQDLRIFDDSFLDYLFDLVEETRYMHDETFNYSVIKLIAALNEQFMVAILPTDGSQQPSPISGTSDEPKNRLIRVLMRRLGSSKTFGENMIFMLNRAKRTPEDLCMQLLLLKILYVLFTTKGTSEYFYTNDLCVLVDVFLRELVDLDEESDSLRHTYLRVLHPLLTKTQLRDIPYKRSQILVALESLIRNHCIRDVNPTTKRLVDRCLSGDWCVQLNAQRDKDSGSGSPTSEASTILSPPGQEPASMAAAQYEAGRLRSLKFSKSVENLGVRSEPARQPLRSPLDQARVPTNGSHTSLPGLPSPSSSKPAPNMSKRRTASTTYEDAPHTTRRASHDEDHHSHRHQQASSQPRATSSSTPLKSDEPTSQAQVRNRRPPPAPPKRRKPPAIPLGRGVTMQTIKSSEPSPLSKVFQPISG